MVITTLHLIIFFILAGISSFSFYRLNVERHMMRDREEKLKSELVLAKNEISILTKELEEEQTKKEVQISSPSSPVSSMDGAQISEPISEKSVSEVTYTVHRGDTLWSIAKKEEHFGFGHRWYDIWKANESVIEDFDRIVSGQVLVIPLDKPEGYRWDLTSPEKKKKLLSKREIQAQRKHLTN